MYHAKPKGPTFGRDVQIAKFAVGRYRPGLLPEPSSGYTKNYGRGLYDGLRKVIQPREGIPASGDIGQATWDILWPLLDDYHRWQYRVWSQPTIPKPSPVPDLGALYSGGASVLYHSLTHSTSGISNYPAFDDGWIGGRTLWAVEDMAVHTASGSNPGDAFFARGKSGIDYWYGHLLRAPSVGSSFRKGQAVGTILHQSGGKSHVHLGIDARRLIGHSLLYGATGHGPDYTYGSPTVVTQIREALSL